MVTPFVHDRERGGGVEVVVESCREAIPRSGRRRLGRGAKHVTEPVGARVCRLQRRIRVVERLSPVAGEEEDEEGLAAPAIQGVLQGDVVADGLVHLLAGEPEHAVVHPDPRERTAQRPRLRDLVLVVREHEIEPAAVDLELRAKVLLRHDGALDVPSRPATAPRRLPRRVLARLVRLPQCEVARILLACIRLLLLDLVRTLAAEPAVVGKARDAVVHVSLRLVREAALDELLDHRDLLRDRLDCRWLDVGAAELQSIRVLHVPAGRSSASWALAPGAAS